MVDFSLEEVTVKRNNNEEEVKKICLVIRYENQARKKKMVKACEGGKEKLIHFGAGYGHNYSSAARKSFRLDTSVVRKSKLSAQC